jgi:hypothetical protein
LVLPRQGGGKLMMPRGLPRGASLFDPEMRDFFAEQGRTKFFVRGVLIVR